MHPRNIVVIGNYGAGNLGDDAVFGGILADLKAIGFRGGITVMHGGSDSSKNIYKGIKKVPFVPFGLRSRFFSAKKETRKALEDADLVILGGGGLFTDAESIFAPMIWASQIKACQKLKKPYVCYGQSVGPLNSWLSRRLTKTIFRKAKAIHVRDEISKKTLEDLGIKNITVGVDSALSYFCQPDTSIKKSEGEQKSKVLLVALRLWPGTTAKDWEPYLSEINAFAKTKKLKPILLAMDIRNQKEVEAIRKTGMEFFLPDSASLTFKAIQTAKLVVSMRLHSGLMAAAKGIPLIELSYSEKVAGTFKALPHGKNIKVIKMDLNALKKTLKTLDLTQNAKPNLESKITQNQVFLAQAIDFQ